MHADAVVLEATPPKSPVPEPQANAVQANATQTTVSQAPLSQPPLSQHPEARGPAQWIHEAELELKKIPFFVRGKARRNTERYALEKGLFVITVETLYDAKAHFGR
jgi:light-independent protochlorophyllide reductase subunit B